MKVRARLVIATSFAWASMGCDTPSARDVTTEKPRVTDDTACVRLCDALVACGGSPGRCPETCEEDRARLRPGFEASFVSCVEHELVAPACSPSPTVAGDETARSTKISLCYSATLEAYAGLDGDKSLVRVVTSICKRNIRCGHVAEGKEEACVAELSEHAKEGAVRKVLAAAREELVGKLATCVEARDCADVDPVAPCLGVLQSPVTLKKEAP